MIYPAYATIPRAGIISALGDQSIAGVIMWVPGSLVFLVAAVWLVMGALNAPRDLPVMTSAGARLATERPGPGGGTGAGS